MKLRTDLVLRKIGNDYIIVDPAQEMVDMSYVYTMNETAAWLWQQVINSDFTQDTLINLLLDEFDVEKDNAENDSRMLIDLWEDNNLLEK